MRNAVHNVSWLNPGIFKRNGNCLTHASFTAAPDTDPHRPVTALKEQHLEKVGMDEVEKFLLSSVMS